MRNCLLSAVYAVCAAGYLAGVSGCGTLSDLIWATHRTKVTAISLNPEDGELYGEETGIPFYLPKPLLIIAKNFRNIEEARTGLTDSAPIPNGFDDQSKYADLNARTNFNGLQTIPPPAPPTPPTPPPSTQAADAAAPPKTRPSDTPTPKLTSTAQVHFGSAAVTPGVTAAATPSDGLSPATFYTYHIVFVPDLTQRYGLKVRGGPGEIRAAMNLVNGWQFTGIGPFYMKDSATAQNMLASGISTRLGGQAAADVINAAANLGTLFGKKQDASVPANEPNLQRIVKTMCDIPSDRAPMTLPHYAEIHVYDAHLTPLGEMEWREVTNLSFNRDFLGTEQTTREYAPKKTATSLADLATSAVANLFGVPACSPALNVIPNPPVIGPILVPPGGIPGTVPPAPETLPSPTSRPAPETLPLPAPVPGNQDPPVPFQGVPLPSIGPAGK
jgi:hypothetical protein